MKGSALEVRPTHPRVARPCRFDGLGGCRREANAQLAIVSNSKHFLSLPLIQHLVRQIYTGHLVYSPQSSRSLIADSYISDRTRIRRRPSHSSLHHPSESQSRGSSQAQEDLVEVYPYNPYESGWLDHQRLRVPKWRKWLDFISFVILMSLFVATLACMSPSLSHRSCLFRLSTSLLHLRFRLRLSWESSLIISKTARIRSSRRSCICGGHFRIHAR